MFGYWKINKTFCRNQAVKSFDSIVKTHSLLEILLRVEFFDLFIKKLFVLILEFSIVHKFHLQFLILQKPLFHDNFSQKLEIQIKIPIAFQMKNWILFKVTMHPASIHSYRIFLHTLYSFSNITTVKRKININTANCGKSEMSTRKLKLFTSAISIYQCRTGKS